MKSAKHFLMGVSAAAALVSLFISTSFAANPAQVVADYSYPPLHPYIATLTSQLAAVDAKFQMKSKRYVLLPARNKILGSRGQLEIDYSLQKDGTAPLAFVVSGLGGAANSSTTEILASYYFQAGYSVVTLPNPFSWNFLLAASHSGLVGYTPTDAQELYDFMKIAASDLTKINKLQPRYFVLGGYSLGALESGFLLHIDQTAHAFNFQNVLLINPPIDLAYGINTLDQFYADGDKLPPGRRTLLVNVMMDAAASGELSLNNIAPLMKKYGLQTIDFEYTIGTFFHSSLTDVILASQQLQDRGLLRDVSADKYSFVDYINKFFIPFEAPGAVVNDVLYNGSLEVLWSELGQNEKVEIMHNADDFLLKPGDVEKIFQNFGSRAVIYPRGGHVGNIWYDDNRKWILEHVKVASP